MHAPRCQPIVALAAAIAGLVGAACSTPPAETASVPAATATDRPDPYALMTREFFEHPQPFQVAVARGAADGVRRNLPEAQLAFVDQAVVTNLGPALRAIVVYRGEIPAAGGPTRSIDAELRQYIHPAGMVVVEIACFGPGSRCEVPRDLIDRTDTAVQEHLEDDGVQGLLPRDTACEPASKWFGDSLHPSTVCRPGPDLRLSVMRLSRDETIAEFERIR